ncbi:NAD(P)/FAD-dependent oxidoreductase [Brotaphodocola sp.]|uniref:NAD(P)/FAD-dependent oxidoreductase n=1 Tax=Brotaphodocola sp. TaxID=3073577 RepID=UPI003D7DE763
MNPVHKSVVIIGGGPAGLAAALRLYEKGIRDLVILEREHRPGGILRQCIHDGFGLTRFKETLSGPEYAARFVDQAEKLGIEIITDTTVIGLTKDRIVTAASPKGLLQYQADAVILAMGCRERTRGALSIPGERPAGVFTAGVAQTYVNLKNTMVGRNVIILGSGDIGMIMARRMTLEGAKVLAVFEIQPYPSGLPRNIEQCLNDYGIPLYLSHTVTGIHGKSRLESVTVSEVDENLRPIPGTEKDYDCDTLILSVGLIPENELSLKAGIELDPRTKGPLVDENCQTTVPGIFAAGNVLHVHDLVDFVSLEAERLADAAADWVKAQALPECEIAVQAEGPLGYVLPEAISGEKDVTLSMRVRRPMKNCRLEICQDGEVLVSKKLKKAIPAEMEQIVLPHAKLKSKNPVKVVICGE